MSSPTTATAANYAISIDDVRSAAARIDGAVHLTPVLSSETMNQFANEVARSIDPSHPSDLQLFFKCENFQKIGAFKFRGALNAVRKAMEDLKAQGKESKDLVVITHSSGNHAQALALAAKLSGIRSVIVIPRNAPQVKLTAVKGYGGEIVLCEPTQAAREKMCAEQVALYAPNSLFVPPYDYSLVMAGQGTLGLEFLDQVKDLDALIVELGGGGLTSGVCIAAKAINPLIRIYGAEPAEASDAFQSLTTGKLTTLTQSSTTIADGLRAMSLGNLTHPIIRDHLSGVITVTEEEIIKNMKLVFERMKIVIEPSAAVGVAAAMSKQFHTTDSSAAPFCRDNNPHVIGMDSVKNKPIRRVGVVICGGNVDLDALPWIKQ